MPLTAFYQYRFCATDTARIRAVLATAGLPATVCRMSGSHWYAYVHTADNNRAVPILAPLGYKPSATYANYNGDKLMLCKIVKG
jgi:hypothetical protein